jgi:hypothetical protein
MTMTKLQISIVSAVLVGGVATPLLLRSQAQARAAQAALKEQTDQLAAQSAETERLSNLLAQASSAGQLADQQTADLARLRREVAGLRRQSNDWARAQADNARLRAALDKSAATPASAQNAGQQDFIQRESWAFAGYADPESAFQSALWAMGSGNAKAFLGSLSPEGQNFKDVQNKPESDLAIENQKELAKVTGYKVINKEIVSDSEVILTVFAQGENATTMFRVQRVGDEWKIGGPVKGGRLDRK